MRNLPNLQHVNVKFFLEDAEAIDLKKAIHVFHSWIQEQKLDDLLIDVADYRHVPSGPGVILIGHNAQYSFDNTEGQLGVLYNQKTPMETSGADLIASSLRAALHICHLLMKEEAFQGKIKFAKNKLQFVVNDRLLAPNNEETYKRLQLQFADALTKVFGQKSYQFSRDSDPRKRLTIVVEVPQGFEV